MPLTEQMKRWNQQIEEEMKKTSDIGYLDSFPEEIKEIYEELKKEILNLYPNINIVPKKNYISFKAKTNFLDIQPQQRLLKGIINVRKGKLKSPTKILRDISKVGHFGAGDYEFSISSIGNIKEIMGFIIQSHKINS